MAPGRHHPVALAQPGPDRARLGRRLDDDDIHDAPSAARAAPGAPGDRGAGIGQFFGRRETARPVTAMTGRTPAACPRAAGSAGAARIAESTKGGEPD